MDEQTSGRVKPNRLESAEYKDNFADLHPPLTPHEAVVEASRCYFCYDAPCIEACPTSIDIPLFIRQIAYGRPEASAMTILDSNIFGGMCARVCPTETLCEEKCVREVAEGKPVEIGRLQRFATDTLMDDHSHPYTRERETGKRIAVIGAGPAGLSCAHRLAMRGNAVTVYEKRHKPGGLNEYGIAAYKTVDEFAQREIDWLLRIGGIEIEYGSQINSTKTVIDLLDQFDAVFVGIGLADNNPLPVLEDLEATRFAVDFISDLRQADDYSSIAVGDDVVVIGGGMTAIDAAVQASHLGAGRVTIAYRKDRSGMKASEFEQELALSNGVRLATGLVPTGTDDHQGGTSATFRTLDGNGTETIRADQILVAIGQRLDDGGSGLDMHDGRIMTHGTGRTSIAGIWAGGDCVDKGENLTVTAVAQGRDAAEDIHSSLNPGRV